MPIWTVQSASCTVMFFSQTRPVEGPRAHKHNEDMRNERFISLVQVIVCDCISDDYVALRMSLLTPPSASKCGFFSFPFLVLPPSLHIYIATRPLALSYMLVSY